MPDKTNTLKIPVQNGQMLTVVTADDGEVTLRISKDGHNRAIAKLDKVIAETVGHHLIGN